MKVLVIAIHPLQDNRISKMIHTVSGAGNKVIYINISTNQNCDEAIFKGIKLIKIHEAFRKNNPIGVLTSLNKVKKIIRRSHPDVVHIHDPHLIPLLKEAKKIGAITVYDKHEAYEVMNAFPAKIGTFFEKSYIKYIDGVVYVADTQLDYLKKIGYKHIAKVPNYQSAERFSKVVSEPHEGCRLIYVGDLTNGSRNTLEMLDVVEKVLSTNKNTSCLIGGSTEDLSVINRINELNGKLDNFTYKGYMLYDDVIKETVNSDIGLYLTKYDPNNVGSSPNKINEYLLAGIAVVSQGRFQDWEIINGKAGFVFNYGCNSDEIAKAIQSIINDKQLLETLKEGSKQLGNYRTYESVEHRYIDLYREITSSNVNFSKNGH